MKKIKKWSFILACIIGFSTFATACKDKNPSSSSDSSEVNMSQGIDTTTVVSTLVADGNSEYTVVIPAEADECIVYAAEEFSKYVEEVSGVELPIKTDAQVPLTLSGSYISLGNTTILDVADLNVDYSSLNYDGFVMKTVGKNLLISGYQSAGVLYGVYDFCEQFLGIRFLTSEATYVPTMETISLYKTNRTEIPAFSNRDYYAYQSMNDKAFASRLRMNSTYNAKDLKYGEGGLVFYGKGDGHTADLYIPYATYGEAHSDWFAKDGKQLCYTNGITLDGHVDSENTNSMAQEMLRVCKEAILENTVARYLMIGQADNAAWCDCDSCNQSKAENGGRSGTLMIFINAIAEEIEKWLIAENIDRDVTIATFSYWQTIDAPTVLNDKGEFEPVNEKVVARDNVAVKFAWMGCFMHGVTDEECSVNRTFHNRLKAWSTVTKRLTIWDYATNYTDHLFWFENFEGMVADYKYYQSIGVEMVMTQGAPHVANYYQGHLVNYVSAKLMWNPNYDVNKLIAEFNRYYYGESAETMNTFVNYMRMHYYGLDDANEFGFHTELYDAGSFKDFTNYPIGFLEGAMTLLETEMEKVETSNTMTAAEKETMRLRLLQAYIQPQYMTLKGYDAYYDPSTKKEYAKSVFDNIDALNIKYIAEGGSVTDAKSLYGL